MSDTDEEQAWDQAPSWDEHFLALAKQVATKSRNPSTKCGCVIVTPSREILTTGFNGFPRGILYLPDRVPREIKAKYDVHAEANAIFNAARIGVSLLGAYSYSTGPNCRECAKALIQAGIVGTRWPEDHQFRHRLAEGDGVDPLGDDWSTSMKDAIELFVEARVVWAVVPGA